MLRSTKPINTYSTQSLVIHAMKRFRVDGDCGGADMLMLLSRGHGERKTADLSVRVFECKTCNRQFGSFQALGGHRASHKKPRVCGAGGGGQGKPRVHECSVCGLEFAIGQALGGHMRRHRAHDQSYGAGRHHGEESKVVKKMGWLDLNLSPSENENECRKKMGFGIHESILDNINPMVDCFH